ncbi:MAG: transposase [Dysgonamonadaceae bacterium]|nr:transposase [Dysgonamonadaceae bacterium]
MQKYICGIISQDKCKPVSIYCNPDYMHVLAGFRPSISVSDLVKDIKSVSSKFINEQQLMNFHFSCCSISILMRVGKTSKLNGLAM